MRLLPTRCPGLATGVPRRAVSCRSGRRQRQAGGHQQCTHQGSSRRECAAGHGVAAAERAHLRGPRVRAREARPLHAGHCRAPLVWHTARVRVPLLHLQPDHERQYVYRESLDLARSFGVDHRLPLLAIATVSQYYHWCYFPHMVAAKDKIQQRLLAFFDSIKDKVLAIATRGSLARPSRQC